MDRFPVTAKRRRAVEFGIRIIDLVIYLAVFTGGIYALLFTPNTILTELNGWDWLIPWWAGFLIVGGLLGFVGRASTIWLIEPAAAFASSIGVLIYAIVLARTSFTSVTSAVAVFLLIVAFLNLVRRYFELQLFGSDPTHNDLKSKFIDALHRRIPNVPPRE